MSAHECPPEPALGPALLAAARLALDAIRQHLTHPDPKVALRAASELTKLLSACARNGIELTSRDREGAGSSPTSRDRQEAISGEGEAPAELLSLVAPASEPVVKDTPARRPVPPETEPAPSRSRLVEDASAKRSRRTPYHELRPRHDPPPETARPPSAIPA